MDNPILTMNKYKCSTCGSTRNAVIKKAARFGIYCQDCGKLIKWSDESLRVACKARLEWLKAQKEV